MRLHKKVLLFMAILLSTVVLVACEDNNKLVPPIDDNLTFTFSGIGDVTIDFKEEFNVLDGVTVKGSDDQDYTNEITFQTTSLLVNKETGDLDTTVPGNISIRYEIKVGNNSKQEWRTITIKTPPIDSSKLLQNGDFSEGIAHWTTDQGTISPTVVDGELKLDIISGNLPHEPRLYQMGIPFEKNQAYTIKFEAKTNIEKTINLQAGALLPDAPWFTDFKPGQQEHRKITTDWDTYEYTFLHILDNKEGGVLFEFGTVVAGEPSEFTAWIRNIIVTKSDGYLDETPPVITGLRDRIIALNSDFDLLKGISANDNVDGDLTAEIFVIIEKDGKQVEEIDTTKEGEYQITYTVIDSSDNKTTETITITIADIAVNNGNLIVNGNFDNLDNWLLWFPDWEPIADVSMAVDENILDIDIKSTGYEPGHIQLQQQGLDIKQGESYILRFKAKASVARDMNIAIVIPGENYYPLMEKKEGVELTTEFKDYEFIFTVDVDTPDFGQLGFELGQTNNAENGIVSFKDLKLNRLLIDPDFTNEKHVVEQASEFNHATAVRTEDSLEINVLSVGSEAYIPHYFYELDSLDAGTYTIQFKVTANISRTLRFNIVLPNAGFISLLPNNYIDLKLEEGETYLFNQEFTIDDTVENVKIELDFGPIIPSETNEGVFLLKDILLVLES